MTAPGEVILETRNVVKSFGGLRAVDDVSIQVRRGEFLGLIGPNGAGKSTLFNVICGVHRPDSGEVRLRGRPIQGLRPHQIARIGIARTFQITRIFRDMTVLENVALALGGARYQQLAQAFRLWRRPETLAAARELLAEVGMADQEAVSAHHLSLGHMRRLEIIRTMAMQPEVLMLDEPCAGLDQAAIEEFQDLVLRLNAAGTTIVMVEHNMSVVSRLCHRIVVLARGRKIFDGPSGEARRDPAVIEAYLGEEA